MYYEAFIMGMELFCLLLKLGNIFIMFIALIMVISGFTIYDPKIKLKIISNCIGIIVVVIFNEVLIWIIQNFILR